MKTLTLAVLCLLVPLSVSAQYRSDPYPFQTIATNVQGGLPQVLAVPNGSISFCFYPANGVPCTNHAPTYTDATLGSQCPSGQPVVLAGTATCTAFADAQGNFGFWSGPGQFAYTVSTNYGTFGPYWITVAGGTGVVSSGTTGQVAYYSASGSTVSGNSLIAFNGGTINTALVASTLTFPPSPTGINDQYRWDVGGYPMSSEYGSGTIAVQSSLTGLVKVPNNSTIGQASGVSGYALSGSGTAPGGAVGLLGLGFLGGVNGAWGANLLCSNFNPATPSTGIAGNCWGIEIDLNSAPSGPAPNSMFGITVVSGAYQKPSAFFDGVLTQVSLVGQQLFNYGFRTEAGSANVAFMAGPTAKTTNSVGSQPIQLQGRDNVAGLHTAQIVADDLGDLSVESEVGAVLFFGDVFPHEYFNAGLNVLDILARKRINFAGSVFANLAADLPNSGDVSLCTNCTVNSSPCTVGAATTLVINNGGVYRCY